MNFQYSSFKPKKSFGQNFLINPHIVDKIIDSCQLNAQETIIEIGPGKGALTKILSAKVKKVIAIEKDRLLAKRLNQQFKQSNVEVIEGDILKFPIQKLPKHSKIIGNLPYNAATAIIEKFVLEKKDFSSLYVTVQLEHGLRMTAKPKTKDYGTFSCFIQLHCDVKRLFNIKNTSFRPVPKVQSCFMHLNMLKNPRYKVKNEELLFHIIHLAFNQRRKTIQNSLQSLINKETLNALFARLDIDPKSRADHITLEEYVELANLITE